MPFFPENLKLFDITAIEYKFENRLNNDISKYQLNKSNLFFLNFRNNGYFGNIN